MRGDARRWYVSVAFLIALSAAHAHPDATEAQRITTVDWLVVPLGSGTGTGADADAPPAADAPWTQRQLPLVFRGDAGGDPSVHWFRVRAQINADGPVALYMPRPMGAVRYYANGGRLTIARGGYGFSSWNRPELIHIPPAAGGAPRDGPVEVLLAIRTGAPWWYGLTAPWIGPSAAVATLFVRAEYERVILPQTIAIALSIIGALALLFWLARPREVAYLLFALATAVWFVRTLYYWIDDPILSDPWDVWLHVNALTWLMALVYAFAFRLLQRRFGYLEVLWIVLALAVAVLTLPYVFGDMFTVSSLAYALQSLIALGVTVFITWSAVRRRDLDVAVLAASLWLNLALGVHDLLLKEMLIDIERVFLLPYGGVAIFAAFLFSAQRRFVAAIEGIERSNVELEARVHERSEQLQAAFARLRGLERERAQAEERQRLLREMHDGLGSSLMSSLALVEQGKMDIASVSQVLRECVDDLKLTMDSMEPIEGDLATLLATLRYRLGRRLEGAGLALRWEVGDLPALPWLDSAAALQVLRILQEALANVVKHAQATSITVSTALEDGRVKVCVDDDGRGLPAASAEGAGGRGLRNMRRRAEEIGARLAIEARRPGTRVALSLPRVRQSRVAASPDRAAGD